MTTALLFSSNDRLREGVSFGFDANGRAACNDFGITNGLNFFCFLSIGFTWEKRKNEKKGETTPPRIINLLNNYIILVDIDR